MLFICVLFSLVYDEDNGLMCYNYEKKLKKFMHCGDWKYMRETLQPIIYDIPYNREFQTTLKEKLEVNHEKFITFYPTVYIINDEKSRNNYKVYVGETNNIYSRTKQHILADVQNREDFEEFEKSSSSRMYIIAHEHFNKSLTMDIENKLIHYLSSQNNVEITNRRTNQQNEYFPVEELGEIFSKIWNTLSESKIQLFHSEKEIQNSAIFKASPFHKLKEEQLKIRDQIALKIESLISINQKHQLILVEGEAGAGKTVLLSSLFNELFQIGQSESLTEEYKNIQYYGKDIRLLVNHEQQFKVYKQLAERLGMTKINPEVVSKPTRFIRTVSESEPVDIVLIDEAHLLWTEGKQAYQGKNQLYDILKRAKIVVAVFDKNQVLSREQYVEKTKYLDLLNIANAHFDLRAQLRINASEETIFWIRNLIDNQLVKNIPEDLSYDLKIFDSPTDLYKAIKEKARTKRSGLSRLLATFDWPYSSKKTNNGEYWNVETQGLNLPWNLQLPKDRKTANLAWAEQTQTINEVGSTFTIQGFDLNYAGVIIGPSVKYANGKIVFDPSASFNRKATQRRTFDSGEKVDVSLELLKNELNVLLTRGVNGLYIYAVDEQLRDVLLKSQKGDLYD